MQKKRTEPVQMEAAGGVVYREDSGSRQVLLIYKNDTWDLPKGKLEDDESIPMCAVREVMEETGLDSAPVIEANLGTTTHRYCQGEFEIEKETYWFVMTLETQAGTFTPQESEGIEKVGWVPAEEAEERVGYENLKELLRRFRNHEV